MRRTRKVALASALIGVGLLVAHLGFDSIHKKDIRVFLWGMLALIAFFVVCLLVVLLWHAVIRPTSASDRREQKDSNPNG
jgi:hypothetical protein